MNDRNIGLGLACSKEIANSLGGDVDINFSEEHFTSFSFKTNIKLVYIKRDSRHSGKVKYSSDQVNVSESFKDFNKIHTYLKN